MSYASRVNALERSGIASHVSYTKGILYLEKRQKGNIVQLVRKQDVFQHDYNGTHAASQLGCILEEMRLMSCSVVFFDASSSHCAFSAMSGTARPPSDAGKVEKFFLWLS